MGACDTVTCDYPIPDPAYQNERFQTKSLDCVLNEFKISADGKLLKRRVDRQGCGNRWLEIPGTERWEIVPFDSDIYFYAYLADTNTFVIYRARFESGLLLSIKRARSDLDQMRLTPE